MEQLCLIVTAFFIAQRQDLAVVCACVGAALFILCGIKGQNRIGQALSVRPLLLVGLASYSIYLVHWPIVVFLRIRYGYDNLPFSIGGVAILGALALGFLMWHFVEKPFRFSHSARVWPRLTGVTALVACTLAGSAAIITENGAPQRFDAAQIRLLSPTTHSRADACFDRLPDEGLCRLGAQTGQPDFLLWGDSHANSFFPAVATAAQGAQAVGLFAGKAGCEPIQNASRGYKACDTFNEKVLAFITENPEIKRVILAARWAYAQRRCDPYPLSPLPCASETAPQGQDINPRLRNGLTQLVSTLQSMGRDVVIIGGTPEFTYRVPDVLARNALWGDEITTLGIDDVRTRNDEVESIMEDLRAQYGVQVVWLADDICKPSCELLYAGVAAYVDTNHVSQQYAKQRLGPIFLSEIWKVVQGAN